ncbi:hypothetical protein VMCG_10916 [Cytospora schulzeri]|uniref:Cytochrome P450 n=1 Tax=Cytospora schulzeri TaxID=448051 RepID=A0A423V7R7_9PEZI|nr:hypothetical protein VMCG_10916 [Valsa malicola]
MHLTTEVDDSGAPELFTERMLQARLAMFWNNVDSNNPLAFLPTPGVYEPAQAEENYERFCLEFLPTVPAAYALRPDMQFDQRLPMLSKQRRLFHLALFECVCINFKQLLLLDATQVMLLPSYKQVLLKQQRLPSDPLAELYPHVSVDGLIQAAGKALETLESLSGLSMMARAGAKRLAKLLKRARADKDNRFETLDITDSLISTSTAHITPRLLSPGTEHTAPSAGTGDLDMMGLETGVLQSPFEPPRHDMVPQIEDLSEIDFLGGFLDYIDPDNVSSGTELGAGNTQELLLGWTTYDDVAGTFEMAPLAGQIFLSISFSLICIYLLYQWLLPKPIPGIPYNPKATRTLLGDIPDLVHEVSRTRDLTAWLLNQIKKLDSPVVQVFIRPFGRPFVILSDFRETQDIMTKRKEFDRSRITSDLLSGPLPNHHFILPTDKRWKAHRRLLQDLMTPAFLGKTVTPAIYDVAMDLMDLWELKTRLAPGRMFSASSDMYHTSLDAVLAFSFGKTFPHRAVLPQTVFLTTFGPESFSAPHDGSKIEDTNYEQQHADEDCKDGGDEPVTFPVKELHETLQATLGCAAILDSLREAPVPKLTYWWLRMRKSWKKTVATKNAYIANEIRAAVRRLYDQHHDAHDEAWTQSAVDQVVAREAKLAAKEGRAPEFVTPLIMDEIYGFAMAGHETTSTTLVWALKFLTFYPQLQDRLRKDIRAAHTAASAEKRLPTAAEIVSVEEREGCSYLDAFIEEVLRCGTIPAVARDATCDTVLLGHVIPKGSTVFMLPNGPSFVEPAFEIDEGRRSKTSQAQAPSEKHSARNHTDLDKFEPDRWLVASPSSGDSQDEDRRIFDPTAGPQMAFGWGVRGCFGKRLAYLELRIMLTMLVWNFEFGHVRPGLSGWEAVDAGISHKPMQCFVRPRKARY